MNFSDKQRGKGLDHQTKGRYKSHDGAIPSSSSLLTDTAEASSSSHQHQSLPLQRKVPSSHSRLSPKLVCQQWRPHPAPSSSKECFSSPSSSPPSLPSPTTPTATPTPKQSTPTSTSSSPAPTFPLSSNANKTPPPLPPLPPTSTMMTTRTHPSQPSPHPTQATV